MTDLNALEDKPVFSAELFPHRSLGRKGFRVFLTLIALGFAPNALWFAAHGAWPIALYCGATFAAVYVAFRVSYRAARAREHVSVSRLNVSVTKVAPSGRRSEAHFNPFWARFSVDRHDEFGITRMTLAGEGRRTEMGAFLNPDDRESFARAFRQALATVKQRI
ncbi:DUF2244 domain-containing protein [Martelella endophytica]|uniref:Membrane protein n=1 Tax=Martelella endophytica TaxID=1486262 RepID=A0A0D5LN51_MAREN|nr:DUF2244 domain-containing protein [Martelella endophytica]AJY45207.1 membrane protein [Martelella endophytica]